MSEYIKREDAINALATSQGFGGINADKLNKKLNDIPSADVVEREKYDDLKECYDEERFYNQNYCVEVVRCEDCKYCTKGIILEQRADGFQKIVNECNITKPAALVKLNHYCGYGKRRDE